MIAVTRKQRPLRACYYRRRAISIIIIITRVVTKLDEEEKRRRESEGKRDAFARRCFHPSSSLAPLTGDSFSQCKNPCFVRLRSTCRCFRETTGEERKSDSFEIWFISAWKQFENFQRDESAVTKRNSRNHGNNRAICAFFFVNCQVIFKTFNFSLITGVYGDILRRH